MALGVWVFVFFCMGGVMGQYAPSCIEFPTNNPVLREVVFRELRDRSLNCTTTRNCSRCLRFDGPEIVLPDFQSNVNVWLDFMTRYGCWGQSMSENLTSPSLGVITKQEWLPNLLRSGCDIGVVYTALIAPCETCPVTDTRRYEDTITGLSVALGVVALAALCFGFSRCKKDSEEDNRSLSSIRTDPAKSVDQLVKERAKQQRKR